MAVKFETNIPLTLNFPFGDCREVNGQYGLQYMYAAEISGTRDRLFATPLLHQALQEAPVGPGAQLTITKAAGEGNRTHWIVQAAAPETDRPAEETPEPVPENGTPSASANGHPAVSRPDFEALKKLLHLSLSASWAAWYDLDDQANFSSEDVRAVGITLFLECARKGVIPQVAVAAEEMLV